MPLQHREKGDNISLILVTRLLKVLRSHDQRRWSMTIEERSRAPALLLAAIESLRHKNIDIEIKNAFFLAVKVIASQPDLVSPYAVFAWPTQAQRDSASQTPVTG